jgi:hypothetical protein
MNRNPSIHGTSAPPSEQWNRLQGLSARYLMNKQLIQFWRNYAQLAKLLHREYSATRAYPECCQNFTEARKFAHEHVVMLMGVQTSLQAEMDALSGQMHLPEGFR